MTDHEINIAIAKAVPEIHIRLYGQVWTPETHGYCYDLNAMHEAEKTLTNEQWDYYCEELGGSLRACAHATASLRAEAFLRTIGKWEE